MIEENQMFNFIVIQKHFFVSWIEKTPQKNFTYVFSFGGNKDSEINLKKDRYAKIFKTEESLTEHKFHNVSVSDLKASNKQIKKIGLIAHGTYIVKRNLNKMSEVISG